MANAMYVCDIGDVTRHCSCFILRLPLCLAKILQSLLIESQHMSDF